MKNLKRSKDFGLTEVLLALNFLMSFSALVLCIINVVKDSKAKKSVLEAEYDYYNLDNDSEDGFGFNDDQLGEISDEDLPENGFEF